jgi:5'-phosphate synthase pdxT subunit
VVAGSPAAGPIGVLDLQGDVREHIAALAEVGVSSDRVQLVKKPRDLDGMTGLIIPGGESTTLSMLLVSTGLFDAVRGLLDAEVPVLGTCAGLVLLASEVLDGRPDQRTFGALDVVVRRNGFGRQAQSFEGSVVFGEGSDMPAVFIRAPVVVSVGEGVDVMARLESGGVDGMVADHAPVLVRQGNVVASSFHPELTRDRRVHELFARMCFGYEAAGPRGAS